MLESKVDINNNLCNFQNNKYQYIGDGPKGEYYLGILFRNSTIKFRRTLKIISKRLI